MRLNRHVVLIALSVISPLSLSPVEAEDDKPNIVVIFGDDIGWMNVSS
jgi:arylsulfatase